VVLNILDLNFLHEGKSPAKARQRLRRLQAKVDRANAILAISQFTADEVRTHLDTGDKPVHVVYLGVESSAPRDATRPSFLPPGAFLFTIGDISPKKNFGVLIDLAEHLPEYRLVVAGRKTSGYARAMQQEISRRGLQHQILMPGEVSDDQRQWLYQHCTAFLFPSLAEGFGLPVLEAMMRGRPVFMSDRTSLPEIGGPLGFYWHTFEPLAMADMCRQGLRFVQDRPEYSHQLRRHAEQFSWQRTAQQYLAIYQELSGGRAATPIRRPCTARRDCA
jgi:glycosyltransferase involved in cell wall biosynthesis